MNIAAICDQELGKLFCLKSDEKSHKMWIEEELTAILKMVLLLFQDIRKTKRSGGT